MLRRHIPTAALLLCGTVILSAAGCGTDTPDTMETTAGLESYAEEDTEEQTCNVTMSEDNIFESQYQYLNKYILSEGVTELSLYLPGESAETYGDFGAVATLDGITVCYEVNTKAQSTTLYDAVGDKYQEEYDALEADPDIQGITVEDAVENEDWVIQVIDYQTEDDEHYYACRKYIKADALTERCILTTTITIDNSEADTDTETVLSEVLKAAGISEGDGEEDELSS